MDKALERSRTPKRKLPEPTQEKKAAHPKSSGTAKEQNDPQEHQDCQQADLRILSAGEVVQQPIPFGPGGGEQ